MNVVRRYGAGVGSRVVGRGSVLSAVATSLAAGHSVTCLVGEPGVGKTSVWSAASTASREPVVARVTCFEAEAGLGWTVLSDLLSAVLVGLSEGTLDCLPVVQRQAVDVILLRASADRLVVPLDARLAGAALLTLLRLLPNSLIAIDDVQWCDVQSFEAVCVALRRGEDLRVRWLLSRRHSTRVVFPGECVITVPPMDALDLRAVVAEHSGHILTPLLLDELVRVSGGNPFYALEVVRARGVDCVAGDVVNLPTVAELVAARVAHLPVRTSRALLDVAVRATVSLDYEHLSDLDPAFDSGVLARLDGCSIGFTHPLLAAGVLSAAAPGALIAAHRRAADRSGDVVARARHIAAATPGSDEQVASQLDEAVKVAVARGDVNGAAYLAERALTLGAEPAARWDRLAAATRTATKAFDRHAETWAEQLVELSAPGPQRAHAYLLLSRTAEHDLIAGLAFARRGLSEPGLTDELRADLVSHVGNTLINLGRVHDAVDVLADAIPTMRTEGPGWAAAVAAWTLAARLCGRTVDMPRLARAADLTRRIGLYQDAFDTLGMIATFDDRHDDARSAFAEGIAIADAAGTNDMCRFHLVELMIRTGELPEAVQLARQIVATSDGQALAANTYALSYALAWLGDEDASRVTAAQSREVSLATSDGKFWIGCDIVTGFLELTLRHHEAAWTLLAEAAEMLHRQETAEPSRFPVLPLAIETAAALGDLEAANRLLDRLQHQSDLHDSRWARAALLRARGHIAASQDPGTALTLLANAATAFRALHLPLEEARSLLARGSLARRHRQRGLARTDLANALEIFDHHGAKILAEHAREELAKLGGRTKHNPQLTTSEQTTAELAAAGLSNAQIAQQLSVSVKTVETHLGHVFHKLGIHSRVQLANTLSRGPTPQTTAREPH